VAVEGLLTGGELRVVAIFRQAGSAGGPILRRNHLRRAFTLTETEQELIKSSFAEATRALGSRTGQCTEVRLNDRGVWPIEVAARPIGGCVRER